MMRKGCVEASRLGAGLCQGLRARSKIARESIQPPRHFTEVSRAQKKSISTECNPTPCSAALQTTLSWSTQPVAASTKTAYV